MRTGVLIAHPDDEAWAFSSAWSADDSPVALLCTTRGEAGADFSGQRRRAQALSLERTRELAASVATLDGDQGRTAIEHLDLPDGRSASSPARLVEGVGAWVEAHRLERVLTWGPAGGYGHIDHVACFDAARALQMTLGVELWTAVFPAAEARALYERLRKVVRAPILIQDFDAAREAERIDRRLAVHAPTKARALEDHRTQLGSRRPEDFVFSPLNEHLFIQEDFMVWPASVPDERP